MSETKINWYPGHMAKTRKEIISKLSLIDLVFELIDSRIPYSSRIYDIDKLIGNKPKILIFTKYDLCDKSITDKFIDEYKKSYDVIKTNLKENSNISKEIVNITEKLLNNINTRRQGKGLNKRSFRALVIGVPNVGKSTLINKLAGRNITETGNRAGVTKSLSWIKLNKAVELLDTPGILWPKLDDEMTGYNLACLTSIKEEILDKEDIACYIIKFLYKYYPSILKDKYGIEEIADISLSFDKIGRKRGCLMKGNVVDLEKVYSIIFNDLKEGKVGKITFDRM